MLLAVRVLAVRYTRRGIKSSSCQFVTLPLDQSVLPDRPLVVGPVYELNKDLAGHPDGRLPNEPKPDCPAKV